MTPQEIREAVAAYDDFIQQANDDNRYGEGWRPPCLAEFIENDWPEISGEAFGTEDLHAPII